MDFPWDENAPADAQPEEDAYVQIAMDDEGYTQMMEIQQSYEESFLGGYDLSGSVNAPGPDGLAALEEQTYWEDVQSGVPQTEIAEQLGYLMREQVASGSEDYDQYYHNGWEIWWAETLSL